MSDKYLPHLFYDVSKLKFETRKKIIEEASEHATKIEVDVLDARVSWKRQKSDKTFEEMLSYFTKDSFFSICSRSERPGEESAFEISFTQEVEGPRYTVWIYQGAEWSDIFIKKFKLKANVY